jgi:sugar lactone lactonase YvrE
MKNLRLNILFVPLFFYFLTACGGTAVQTPPTIPVPIATTAPTLAAKPIPTGEPTPIPTAVPPPLSPAEATYYMLFKLTNEPDSFNANPLVQKFDNDGRFLTSWGGEGAGDGQFLHATGIVSDNEGNIYVADYQNKRVQKFDTDGNFLLSWQIGGNVTGTPEGLAIDDQGNLYVADYALAQVEVYSPDGDFLTRWGSRGSADLQFIAPVAIAIDSAGDIYISDQKTNTIQKIAKGR